MNWQYGHRSNLPSSRAGKVHTRVMANLKSSIERMLLGSPSLTLNFKDVVSDLKGRRISYTGEEIGQPSPLSVEQMIKGLPPVGHGGSIPILPFIGGRAKYLLENPRELLLEKEDRGDSPCTARVHIAPGQELDVFQLLYERGVITWVDSSTAFSDERGEYLSGMFGVVKQGRFTESGLPVLRCMMNLIPVNAILSVVDADISLLPSAASCMATPYIGCRRSGLGMSIRYAICVLSLCCSRGPLSFLLFQLSDYPGEGGAPWQWLC